MTNLDDLFVKSMKEGYRIMRKEELQDIRENTVPLKSPKYYISLAQREALRYFIAEVYSK